MSAGPKRINLSLPGLLGLLLLMLLAGAAVTYYALQRGAVPPQADSKPTPPAEASAPTPTPAPVQHDTAPPPPAAEPTPAKAEIPPPKPKATPRPQADTLTPHPKTTTPDGGFIVQGLISTGGEPWAAGMIIVKVLWLQNKDGQAYLLGEETATARGSPQGFTYRLTLRPQDSRFLNLNGGVEGNVGRVIAFLDHKRDGRLSPGEDRIIAVSNELLRYRTGRYDKGKLNETQQQNIRQSGRGYALISNVQGDDGKADWQVLTAQSPARLDLDARQTGLPKMYNSFMKLK